MLGMNTYIGIDIGSTNIRIYTKNKGKIVDEPNVACLKGGTNEPLSFGLEGIKLLKKNPGLVKLKQLTSKGVVNDYGLMVMQLNYYINKHLGKKGFLKSKVVISIPYSLPEMHKKALVDAVIGIGASKVVLVEESILTILGSNRDFYSPLGNLVINSGGEYTEVSLIILGNIIYAKKVNIGGKDIDKSLVKYIRNKYNVEIGNKVVERLKHTLLSRHNQSTDTTTVRGKDMSTSLPKDIEISKEEVYEAIKPNLYEILEAIEEIYEKSPKELKNDIKKLGIILAGGNVNIKNFDKLIQDKLKTRAYVLDNPTEVVIDGISNFFEKQNNKKGNGNITVLKKA